MNAERARLLRLRRLEKIRDIAKQTAARDAAEAEGTLAQLRALCERTGRLAGEYAARRNADQGDALRQQSRFVDGLEAIRRNTLDEMRRAEAIADAKLRLLATAERRRAAVDDRAQAQERLIARGRETPALHGRKPSGTGLE